MHLNPVRLPKRIEEIADSYMTPAQKWAAIIAAKTSPVLRDAGLSAQDQTILGCGPAFGEPKGNCWSSCIATLMRLPVHKVPVFVESDNPTQAALEWLLVRKHWLLGFPADNPVQSYKVGTIAIASGYTVRNGKALHAVLVSWQVAPCGTRGVWQLEHDPHPSKCGLLEINDIEMIVPVGASWGAA